MLVTARRCANLSWSIASPPTCAGQLLNNARRELALHHVNNPALEVKEISYVLGFNDASAFIKAFRNWTGITPGLTIPNKL